MGIITDNIGWMVYNTLLALISTAAGFTMLQVPWKTAKVFFGIFWFFFLPNTIYMLTDLIHLPAQWKEVTPYQSLLITEYAVLVIFAVATYILAMYPLEVLINAHIRKRMTKKQLVVFFNIGVGFAMVLGRIERVNSWDVLISPVNLLRDSIHALTSGEQILLFAGYGLLVNCIYFSSRGIFQLLDGKKRY